MRLRIKRVRFYNERGDTIGYGGWQVINGLREIAAAPTWRNALQLATAYTAASNEIDYFISPAHPLYCSRAQLKLQRLIGLLKDNA